MCVDVSLVIEQDLWIPYFNITTDITNSTMRVHTDGEPFTHHSPELFFFFFCLNLAFE